MLFATQTFAAIVSAMVARSIDVAALLLALYSSVWLAACGQRSAAREVLRADGDDAEFDQPAVAEPIPASATLEQIVELKARKYAAGFVAEAEVISGSVVEGGRSDHLIVLRAGHCYRVVAAADGEVQDMDLFLFDPQGVQTQQDPAEDRYPVLGLQAEICPYEHGAYRLQVHMYKGGGRFAARVYRTP